MLLLGMMSSHQRLGNTKLKFKSQDNDPMGNILFNFVIKQAFCCKVYRHT